MSYNILKDYEYICEFVFDNWKKTYVYYEDTINKTEEYINDKYIKKIDSQECDLLEKCNRLCEIYYDIIKRYVTLYSKEDLLVGLISVKEYITKNMTKLDRRLDYIDDERYCINTLINYVYRLEENCFKNHSIDAVDELGYTYIIDIFLWVRQLYQLEANMERYPIAENDNVKLRDMAFDVVEDQTFNNYYELYEKQGSYEKFEDYKIRDISIQKQVKRMNVMPNQIILNANTIIRKQFGFDLNSLRVFSQAIGFMHFKLEQDMLKYIDDDEVLCKRVAYPKSMIYELADMFNVPRDEIDTIIEVFSIEHKTVMEIELSCFYVTKDTIYFGPCDMMQVFGMFEKFALSGSFFNYFKKDIDFVSMLQPCQRALSKYMCYVLTDILMGLGYKMHMEKFTYEKKQYNTACAEVDNIINGKENILKNLGDCDVLFLDEYKKQIVCIEYKYFQPAITYQQLSKTDRNKLTKQVYEKTEQIQRREEALKENIECVVKFLGGSGMEYSIKTIIVIARPNMYVFTDEVKEKIKYEIMTMNEFNDKVVAHNI